MILLHVCVRALVACWLFHFCQCMRATSSILHSFFTSMQYQHSILILLGANMCSLLNLYCCFIKQCLSLMKILSGSTKLRRKTIAHLVLVATLSHMVKGFGMLCYMLRVHETKTKLILFKVVYCVMLTHLWIVCYVIINRYYCKNVIHTENASMSLQFCLLLHLSWGLALPQEACSGNICRVNNME